MSELRSTMKGYSVLDAFRCDDVLLSVTYYARCGFSVIPLRGKAPAIKWQEYTTRRATEHEIAQWHEQGLLQGVGIVQGHISNGLVCIDLDGMNAVRHFYAHFPQYCLNTLSVLSGSQDGMHLYFICEHIPTTTRTKTDIGGFELRANGCYMVAPPSLHPSGNRYTIHNDRPVAHVDDLEDVRQWIRDMIEAKQAIKQQQMDLQTVRRGKDNQTYKGNKRDNKAARQRGYANAIIRNIRNAIAAEQEGARNDALFAGACQMYQYVAGNVLPENVALNELVAAARDCGLSNDETMRTIQSARQRGLAEPRGYPQGLK